MKINRIIILLLIIFPLINSCAVNETIMIYDDSKLSERIYYYWLTQYKSYFLSSIENSSDTAAFWDSYANGTDGETMEEYLTGIIDMNIKKNLICMDLFKEYDLSLSEKSYAEIDTYINDYIYSYGSKSEFNKALAEFNINVDIFREICIIQEQIAVLYEYLYGDNGIFGLTNDELEAYYKDNYMRIKYITINLYDVDEEGTTIQITEDEAAARTALSEEIYGEINTENFDELFYQYSDDLLTGYENGVYFSNDKITAHSVIAKAFEMDLNDIEILKETYAIYIIMKLELEEKPYLDDPMEQFFELVDGCRELTFQNYLSGFISQIKIDENIKAKYSLQNAGVNYN